MTVVACSTDVSPTAEAIDLVRTAAFNRRIAGEHVREAAKILGATIRSRREALGYTRAFVAQRAGVNASEYSKLENGTLDYFDTVPVHVDGALTRLESARARSDRGDN